MKRIIYLLWICMTGVCLDACYDDESNTDYTLLSPITIDVTGLPISYSVLQYGRLRIAPMIYREGGADKYLSFLWQLKGDDTDKELGRGMVLDTLIDDAPLTQPYQVLLTVTDATTGIQEFCTWNLTVLNSLRDGLVVSDTRDGINSDVSLIMSYNFTEGMEDHTKDNTYFNLFSRTNGSPLPDQIIGMFSASGRFEDNRTLTLMGKNSIYRLNPDNYSLESQNNDLFYAPFNNMEMIRPKKILFDPWFQQEVLLMKGLLYRRSCQNGEKQYNFQFMTSNGSSYGISEFCLTYAASSTYPSGFAYDSLNNRFLLMPRNGETLKVFRDNTEGKFNPNQVGNMECRFMDESMDYKVYTVMRDKVTDHYWLYSLKSRIIDDGKSIPLAPVDLDACTDIHLSKYYAVSTLENVLYYATGQTIYAVLLNTSPLQVFPRYSTLGNEKITSMRLWKESRGYVRIPPRQAGDDEQELNAANRMLVITTYDEVAHSGKVVAIPIQTLGVGGLVEDPAYCVEYPGFGRILSVTPNQR